MAECSASVSSATEPVMAPAIALSRISAEFEATESAAAPAFDGSPLIGVAGARLAQVAQQRAGRAAAVADRVLLGRRELGHRAPVVAVVGDEDRVVAEAARAARRVGHRPRAAALEERSSPVCGSTSAMTQT